MTAVFEPFTPAGGARRSDDRYDDRYQDYQRPADPWADQQRPADTGAWPEQTGGWTEEPAWAETSFAPPRQSGGWRQEQPAAQPAQPAAEPSWQQPAVSQTGGWQQPAVNQTGGWQQPAVDQNSGWQQRFSPAPQAAYADVATPAPRSAGGNRYKPLIVGVAVLVLVVLGWQSYRIEAVIRSSTALASATATEKDRSDELEKALTNVFDPEGISAAVLPSVFRVRAGDFTGTAFSVGDQAADGQANLLTNYHVVESVWTAGEKTVSLERGNTRIDATIVKVAENKDLALLSARQEITGLPAATGDPNPGQQVVVVGAPLGLDDTVTTGVISAVRDDDDDNTNIQFDAPINPGNSGGPVVNTSKQVVGLATAKARDAEGIGLAIPIKTACDTFDVC
ncbi:trypsin-like peptidase domain-containing protein [Actinoplanes sp. NPDC051851]|uniref:trypsin-like peptidase domain-containing protein n=1 Tax=Actinoplanes sp. NPDC051851 TaxID=3154753 RepID=UPI00342D41CB